MEKCKFCNLQSGERGLLNDTAEYSGIEVVMMPFNAIRVRVFRDYENDNTFRGQEVVVVNFCPMCGKKLKK